MKNMEDKEKVRTYNREYYKRNREKLLKRRREYRERNPEKYRNSNRKAKQKKIRSFIESRESRCERCGNRDRRTFQIHHRIRIGDKEPTTYETLIHTPWEHLELLCANCHQIIHLRNQLKY